MTAPLYVETIAYRGWEHALRLTTADLEVLVTLDVGPRILHFGRPGGENQLRQFDDQAGLSGGNEFHLYGGHRLWLAPESLPRTYYPDNTPVHWQRRPGGARFTADTETTTGIQKEIDLRLAQFGASLAVTHRLTNRSDRAVETAAWAITQMALGGEAILPLPHAIQSNQLTPVASLALWDYTDLSDPRLHYEKNLLRVRHAGGQAPPLKIGLFNSQGWVAYQRNGLRFTKRFTPQPCLPHPDLGCNSEVFTRYDMLELETLAPLTKLQPGATCEYEEVWELETTG